MRTITEIRKDIIGKDADINGRKAVVADVREFKGSGQFRVDLSGGGIKVKGRRVDMKVVFKDTGDDQWIKGVSVE